MPSALDEYVFTYSEQRPHRGRGMNHRTPLQPLPATASLPNPSSTRTAGTLSLTLKRRRSKLTKKPKRKPIAVLTHKTELRINILVDCVCVTDGAKTNHDPITRFKYIRDHCPILREIIFPDNIWPGIIQTILDMPDEVSHRPVTFLAVKRGYIANITIPLHALVFGGDASHLKITRQYLKDLQETWILKTDLKQRFEKHKIFQGRLQELTFAHMLSNLGFRLLNLEAWGGPFDIECEDPANGDFVIEVKFVGQSPEDFALMADAFKNKGVASARISPHDPVNYSIVRLLECCEKLNKCHEKRIAVIVLQDYSNFEIALKENWINWSHPEFIHPTQNFHHFLSSEKNARLIEKSSASRWPIGAVDEIWWVEASDSFELQIRSKISIEAEG